MKPRPDVDARRDMLMRTIVNTPMLGATPKARLRGLRHLLRAVRDLNDALDGKETPVRVSHPPKPRLK